MLNVHSGGPKVLSPPAMLGDVEVGIIFYPFLAVLVLLSPQNISKPFFA